MDAVATSELGALDALDGAVAELADLDIAALPPAAKLDLLEQLETTLRRQIAIGHRIAASLAADGSDPLGDVPHKAIADRLRISYVEARKRIRDAAQLTPRTSLTGEKLAPELPETARAWNAGELDGAHLRVVQSFVRELPQTTPPEVIAEAERFLVEHAAKLRPDQLRKLADRYAFQINQDGRFCERDRAHKRGFTWSPQRRDGMSIGRLVATPQLRAHLDAWFARFAAPGMCNPDDETPQVSGEPAQEVTGSAPDARDFRSYAQRHHDALSALVRGQLGDPKLGVHNGLPVTVIVSTTLTELSAAAGVATTAGGTLLPMRDVIRMASHAHHYLAVFDDHSPRPLYLGRTRRVASPDQRVVLYARDRGCTRPGCDVPAYHTEVHHNQPWRNGGQTNVDNLTLACPADHWLTEHGWSTRTRASDGRVEWAAPKPLGRPPAANDFHHPERQLGQPPPQGRDP